MRQILRDRWTRHLDGDFIDKIRKRGFLSATIRDVGRRDTNHALRERYMSTNEPSVPAHVPPELVQPIPFQDAPGIERDASGAMDVFRDDRPIVYAPASRRGMGSWVLKSYELIHEAFHTPELFSSDRYSGFSALLGEDWPMPPMEYDPPHHQPF